MAAAGRTAVLLELPDDLLARLDAFWPGIHASRRAAINHSVEVMLAADAQYRQRLSGGPAAVRTTSTWTADDVAAVMSRPLTADLADL